MSTPAFNRDLAIELVNRCVDPPSVRPTDVGLTAAFAAYHHRSFESDQACFDFYGVAKPRFYEWKKTVVNLMRADVAEMEAAIAMLNDKSGSDIPLDLVPVPPPVVLHSDLIVHGIVHAQALRSAGADTAELYPKARPSDPIEAQQVVGLDSACKVSLGTRGALSIGVVSEAPAVCGNVPFGDASREGHSVPVIWAGWSGQVRVRVTGSVAVGDVLVASGQNDGLAVLRCSTNDLELPLGIVESITEGEGESKDERERSEPQGIQARSVMLLMGTTLAERTLSKKQRKQLRRRKAKAARKVAMENSASIDGRVDGWDMCDASSDTGAESDTGMSAGSYEDTLQVI